MKLYNRDALKKVRSFRWDRRSAGPFKLGRRLFYLGIVIAFMVLIALSNRVLHKNRIPTLLALTPPASAPPQGKTYTNDKERCAINLWGLPRAFESLVLPGLVRHVLIPNAAYNCDYFVHFYHLDAEVAGRSGGGGAIFPEQVYLLKDQVLKVHEQYLPRNTRVPTVKFTVTKEADFWEQYKPLLEKIQNTKDENGKLLYFPYNAKTYTNPTTTDNIIKMWHTIEQSWNLMEQNGREEQVTYQQVAMLRSDVLYMTPIDLYEYAKRPVAIVPGFGRYPVSDRLVVGPANAVKIWATHRFPLLEQHVQYVKKVDPGFGLHSERFLNYTIFPAMRTALQESDSARIVNNDYIIPHPKICFFRARADETVWVNDCDGMNPEISLPSIRQAMLDGHRDVKEAVETVLGRSCPGKVTRLTKRVRHLDCSKSPNK